MKRFQVVVSRRWIMSSRPPIAMSVKQRVATTVLRVQYAVRVTTHESVRCTLKGNNPNPDDLNGKPRFGSLESFSIRSHKRRSST